MKLYTSVNEMQNLTLFVRYLYMYRTVEADRTVSVRDGVDPGRIPLSLCGFRPLMGR